MYSRQKRAVCVYVKNCAQMSKKEVEKDEDG